MKILHISQSFYPQSAGYRLHNQLRKMGIDSHIFIDNSSMKGPYVFRPYSIKDQFFSYIRLFTDQSLLLLYKKRKKSPFSPSFVPSFNVSRINNISPSIVHLHWICGGLIQIESLKKIHLPLVWTLHDSWAFTGGCHIPHECTRFLDQCGNCPVLGSQSKHDISNWIWKRKKKSWDKINFHVVTPSNWLADCAKKSSLFCDKDIRIIPNGIDTSFFRPIDSRVARDILQLPHDKKTILFSANSIFDPNKGFNLLIEALIILSKICDPSNVILLIIGQGYIIDKLIPFKAYYLGAISDEYLLPILYSCADVVVVPSLSENFPNTILESLSCGIPVTAFSIGGIPDQVIHKYNGYLANPYSPQDLANGINWILDNTNKIDFKENCRNSIYGKFDIQYVAKKYIDLYSENFE